MALYRKYRPQTFDEVVGQEAVVSILKKALDSGNISHAYLFAGPRGTGKTSIARILAKGLNCEKGITSQPCGKCYMCRAITEGRAVDVIEIDAASNRGIDDIREIRERVKHPPLEGRYKVYIIDEVHMLTREAFNALLKTLEEPPDYVVFVLATTDPHKLPETILSRVQRFNFHKLSIDDSVLLLQRVCKGEGFSCDKEALILIARHSDGAMRDALNLLEQVALVGDGKVTLEAVKKVIGGVSAERVYEFFSAMLTGKPKDMFDVLESVLDEGTDPVIFHRALFEYIGYALDYAIDPSTSDKLGLLEVEREILRLISRVGVSTLGDASKLMIELEKYYRYTERHKSTVLKMIAVKLMELLHSYKEDDEEEKKGVAPGKQGFYKPRDHSVSSNDNEEAMLKEERALNSQDLVVTDKDTSVNVTTQSSSDTAEDPLRVADIFKKYDETSKKKAQERVTNSEEKQEDKEEKDGEHGKDGDKKESCDLVYSRLVKHYPEWGLLYYKFGRLDGETLYFSTSYARDLFEIALSKFGWKSKLLELLKDLGIKDIKVEAQGVSESYVPETEEEAMRILNEIFHV